ncbi:chemotaxis protein CheB [Dyadobacter sp. NIV53]|uniref:chemotaxis protein CheB n=1 Tax=Dyadobacter sp. NIV53 TaxID=2861765 RepID=UPI001C882FBF|nr:chemotaxis protein CheB [Dyadobacter sp. NIV53]
MENRDIVVIGSSAGGVNALKEIAASLPVNFNASVFIVQHISADSISMLPEILSYKGKLTTVHPADGETIQRGYIYIAPPDRHMLIEGDRILIKKGPKENRFRPSVDALFRSAAYNFGSRVIGVVLTGMLDDGTSGMWSIKRLGGLCVVQEPEEAAYPAMPLNVLEYVKVDHVVPIFGIAPLLSELVEGRVPEPEPLFTPERERMKIEIDIAAQNNAFESGVMDMGEFTPITCPECKGVLIRLTEGNLIRYRCHTGHSFHSSSLLGGLSESVESRLWEALKSMEELVISLTESADAFERNGNVSFAEEYYEKAEIVREKAKRLHAFIFE